MLSSGLRKVMKALLILLAAPWITTDANAPSEVSTARLDPERVIERSESAIGRTVGAYRLKKLRCGDRRGEDPAAWKGYPGLVHGRGEEACVLLFLMSCLEPKKVVEDTRFSTYLRPSEAKG